MGPFRGLRTKRPRHVDLRTEKDRASWILFGKIRMKKTAPAGVRAVVMGPFRGLRTKRPRHMDLRTEKDRASWILFGKIRMERDRARWK